MVVDVEYLQNIGIGQKCVGVFVIGGVQLMDVLQDWLELNIVVGYEIYGLFDGCEIVKRGKFVEEIEDGCCRFGWIMCYIEKVLGDEEMQLVGIGVELIGWEYEED